MTYGLGVDLGTTFTGAAVGRPGHTEMISLGNRSVVAPAALFAASSGKLLTGDAALRRAMDEPDRAAREFKRRLGDPTPIMLGGVPYSPARLMAATLDHVIEVTAAVEGMAPQQVVLTHPAVWGPYRREQFAEVPRLSGLNHVAMVAEPVAAATYYSASRDLDDGDLVAVYDLGGGTFDLTIVRVLGDKIEVLGAPEGVEWLGGIDFDEAILSHVDRVLGGAVSALSSADQQQAAALLRLRTDCGLAKEALSTDEVATIRVVLPARQEEVRITREELEAMMRPTLDSTIKAMRRGLESAELVAADLSSVLLVGGSSRIPLVARMVSEALQRPTMVNAHPKHAVALGAALMAARAIEAGGEGLLPTGTHVGTTSSVNSPAQIRPGADTTEVSVVRSRWRRIVVLAVVAIVVLVAAAAAGTVYGRAQRKTLGAPESAVSDPPSHLASQLITKHHQAFI